MSMFTRSLSCSIHALPLTILLAALTGSDVQAQADTAQRIAQTERTVATRPEATIGTNVQSQPGQACAASNRAEHIDDTMPSVLAPGERRCGIRVRMRNSGHMSGGSACPTLWKPEYGYRLGSQNPTNNVLWGLNRVAVDTAATQEGDEVQVFTFCITAPAAEGTYPFQWRMIQEGSQRNCFACGGCETIPGAAPEWFGALTRPKMVRVTNNPDRRTRYVALGDSYASGVGLTPFASNTPGAGSGKCMRSLDSYGYKVVWPPGNGDAQMVRDSYACGGAVTQNLIDHEQFGDAPQFSRTTEIRAADLVTLSIGGNNMGFFNLIMQCSTAQMFSAMYEAARSAHPILRLSWFLDDPSLSAFDPRSCVYKGVYDDTYNRVRRLNCAAGDSSAHCAGYSGYSLPAALARLRAVMKRNRNGGLGATAVVVGYPHVVPSAQSGDQNCPTLVAANLDGCEQNFIRDAVDQINKILQREARTQGFHFLDLRETYTGHNLCETGEPWMQGLFLPGSLDDMARLFHPTRQGHTAIARAIENLLQSRMVTNAQTPAGMPVFRKRPRGDFGGWLESLYRALPGQPGNINWCVPGTGSQSEGQQMAASNLAAKSAAREGVPDGFSDIIWRNAGTGDNSIWYMENDQVVGSAALPRVGDPGNWLIAGISDFNLDGQDDIVWRHQASGTTVIWFMRGIKPVASAVLPTIDATWSIGATADFNGDDFPDIVWRHGGGSNVIWLMNGATAVSAATLPAIADPNWRILGAGDFNGDGSTDLLWHNRAATAMSIWLMDGVTATEGIELPEDIVPDAGWYFGAIIDIDGDDHLDLVWKSLTTGDVGVMYFKHTTFDRFGRLFTLADNSWQIAGPR